MREYRFSQTVFSRIRTKSRILSLCGRLGVRENPYSRIFDAVYSQLTKKVSYVAQGYPIQVFLIF